MTSALYHLDIKSVRENLLASEVRIEHNGYSIHEEYSYVQDTLERIYEACRAYAKVVDHPELPYEDFSFTDITYQAMLQMADYLDNEGRRLLQPGCVQYTLGSRNSKDPVKFWRSYTYKLEGSLGQGYSWSRPLSCIKCWVASGVLEAMVRVVTEDSEGQ